MSHAFFELLLEQIKKIKIIDTHEHLLSQNQVKKEDIDVFKVFESYVSLDFISAGMPPEAWSWSDPRDIWNVFKKYQDAVSLTGVMRVVIRTLQDLYGLKGNRLTFWTIIGVWVNRNMIKTCLCLFSERIPS